MSRRAVFSRRRSTPLSSQTTASDAKTSTEESRPKPTSATEPARSPAAIAAMPSSEFHAIVTYSSRKARRRNPALLAVAEGSTGWPGSACASVRTSAGTDLVPAPIRVFAGDPLHGSLFVRRRRVRAHDCADGPRPRRPGGPQLGRALPTYERSDEP